ACNQSKVSSSSASSVHSGVKEVIRTHLRESGLTSRAVWLRPYPLVPGSQSAERGAFEPAGTTSAAVRMLTAGVPLQFRLRAAPSGAAADFPARRETRPAPEPE